MESCTYTEEARSTRKTSRSTATRLWRAMACTAVYFRVMIVYARAPGELLRRYEESGPGDSSDPVGQGLACTPATAQTAGHFACPNGLSGGARPNRDR